VSESVSESAAAADLGLFDGVLARGDVRSLTADRAWLKAMLRVEAALAVAQARVGVVPVAAADAIADACRPERFDIAKLATAAAASGNPVVPLVEQLRATVPDEVAPYVHKGATSQDILDTTSMLIAHRALGGIMADLAGAADAAKDLARHHRDTPMPGRTLLQQAVPTTFGLKAAGWMTGLDDALAGLDWVRRTRLAVQVGGAAGTRAGMGDHGAEVAALLATELDLAEPVLPWHTIRTRPAELAGSLGVTAGAVGKVARDVTLLAQDEVGEVSEGAPGGSSAMSHKQNPVAAVSALACAAQAPGLVATMLAAMGHEHERAAGAWHAEWRPLRELLVATGSAVAWLRECLENLVVHEGAMRANLASLMRRLGTESPDIGEAVQLVDRAVASRPSGHGRVAR
jgi:3-carboxy-cis,cis-muconate cycloisomerase